MKTGKLFALFVMLLGGWNLVHAQEDQQATNIVRPQPDTNGVDLVTGGLFVPDLGFSAPGAGAMQLTIGRSEKGSEINALQPSLSGYIEGLTMDPDRLWPRMYTANIAGQSARFLCSTWGMYQGSCEEEPPRRGATLEYVNGAYTNGFIYTTSNGTRAQFPYNEEVSTTLESPDVLYPSGEKIGFQHTLQSGGGTLRVWTSNLGYSISISNVATNETRRLYKGGTLLNTITTARESVSGSNYTRRVTDDLGRTTRFRYLHVQATWNQSSKAMEWFEDASGLRTTLNYYGLGAPGGCPWAYFGNLAVHTLQRNGKTWTYDTEYSSNIRIRVIDPVGAVREVISEPSLLLPPPPYDCAQGGHAFYGNIVSDKSPLGRTNSYVYYNNETNYAAWDHPAEAAFPEGNKFKYDYDDRGNLTKTTQIPKTGGAGTVVYQAGYPAACSNSKTCNQPSFTRDSAGSQTDYTYDSTHGGLLTKLGPGGANGKRVKTWNEYEAHNSGNGTVYRLSAVHVCANNTDGSNHDCGTITEQVTRFTYWEHTLLPLTETRTNGTNSVSATTTNGYDAWGRLVSTTDPTGMAIYSRYDVMGRKTWEIMANGAGSWVAKKTTYDVGDRVTRVDRGTLPDPASTSLLVKSSMVNFYDAEGNRTKAITSDAGLGNLVAEQFSYDAVSRPVCTAKRMNAAAFDATADACSVGPAGAFGPDRITKNSYNLDGQVTKTVQGFGAANNGLGITGIEVGYTPNGQVLWRKDGNGNQTNYSYDSYDRLDRTTFADASFERSEYDAAGRLQRFTKRDGQWLAHAYDGASRLTSTTFSNGEATVARGYDAHGRDASITRGAQTVSFDHGDPLGRLASETQPAGTVSYAYDLAGRRTRITWPGGYYVDYDYNSSGKLWRMRELGATSGLGLLATWGFDVLGRPVTLARGNGVSTSIVIDAADRLSTLNQNTAIASQNVQITFDRAPSSQVVSRTLSNGTWSWTPASSSNENYVPDALNRYASVAGTAFSYDGRGNLTYNGSRTFAYNFLNHLVSGSGGGTSSATLAYDPQERLFSITAGGTTTRFLYDGVRVIAEYDGNGNLMRRYVRGGRMDLPLLSLEGTATAAGSGATPDNARWLMVDERGSVAGLANASGTVFINKYGPYGEPAATNQGRFGFTGQLWLQEIGLYHFKSRAYDPRLGRFMQTDPAGYGDGMNLYAYVGNDPLNSSDPTGLACRGVGSDSQCTIDQIAIYREDDHGKKRREFVPLTDGLRAMLPQRLQDKITKLEGSITAAYKTAQTAADRGSTVTIPGKGSAPDKEVDAASVVAKLQGVQDKDGNYVKDPAKLAVDEDTGRHAEAFTSHSEQRITFTTNGLGSSEKNQIITTLHEGLHLTDQGQDWLDALRPSDRANQRFHYDPFNEAAHALKRAGQ